MLDSREPETGGADRRPPFLCPQCGHRVAVPEAPAPSAVCPQCARAFPIQGGIVTLTPPASDADYPAALVALVAGVEARHFWFAARNDVILATLARVVGRLPGRRVLDVGCGTGFVLAALERAGMHGSGIDMHRASLELARPRVRGPLFCSSAAELPFDGDYDLVALCDVIEHVDDDVAVLREARRAAVPGGHVVVTVPAGPELWTDYDAVIGHKRRYERAGLTAACARAGLTIRHIGYFSVLPLLAQRLQRRMSRPAAGPRDPIEIVRRALEVPPAPVNALLRLSVAAEAPLRRLPGVRGGSLIAIAS